MSKDNIYRILQSHAFSGTVTLTGTDSSPEFEGLIANWACNLQRAGLKPLVWAFDLATHVKLTHQRIGTIPITSIYSDRLLSMQHSVVREQWNSSKSEFKVSGSDAYFAAVAFKPFVMLEVLKFGFDLLWIDVDIGLVRDPRPWLLRDTNLDLQISLNFPDSMINSGFVHARSRQGVRGLFASWAGGMSRHDCVGWDCGDQEMLNKLLVDKCNWSAPGKKVRVQMD